VCRASPLVLAVVFLLAAAAANAQVGASPPAFEHVHALAFDAAGRTLWLGAHTGLYRSDTSPPDEPRIDMKRKDSRRRAPGIARRTFLYGAGVTAGGAVAAWQLWPARSGTAAPVTTDTIGDQVQTLPKGQLPVFAGTGEIEGLYRYAVEHGDELQYIPCFCGCARFGHRSNRDCYIKAFNAAGTLCLDVTRDVTRMRSEGKSLLDVRRAIDAKYRGTPTPTPYPKA